MGKIALHHPFESDITRTVSMDEISSIEPLLTDIIRNGKLCYGFPSIEDIRRTRDRDLGYLEPGVRRLINPHRYHVSLSDSLLDLKEEVVRRHRCE